VHGEFVGREQGWGKRSPIRKKGGGVEHRWLCAWPGALGSVGIVIDISIVAAASDNGWGRTRVHFALPDLMSAAV
jgi:hypothetical protein